MDRHMKPKSAFIALSEPCLRGNEWRYVKECLDTGWVSSAGKYVDLFEKTVAKHTGSAYGIACINGTSALHTALMVSGVNADDEVIVPALTFAAPANAVRYCGAYPVFIDAEEDYFQIDPQKLKDFLTKECVYRNKKLVNKHTKRHVKAIIAVHLLGQPCDMDVIISLARRFNLVVIEDAAESIGAKYKGRKVGGIGDIGCLSFNGNKIITAGGGGLLVFKRKSWADYARYLTTQAKDDPIEYIHQEIGYNYRLTNVQAALGLAQFECLSQFIEAKRQIARRYEQGLRDVAGLVLPAQAAWADGYHWLYTVRVQAKKFGCNRQQLLASLAQQGIQTRPLWHPLPDLKPFRSCYSYHTEIARRLYREALSLPSTVSLTAAQQQRVIKALCTSNT